jgi:glyoxylase-like metal-dependent hydrolase (beta-lactamase superfamily II)
VQILRGLYQVGGDLNGVTFDGQDAAYRDGNTYILQGEGGLILFDSGCGDTLDQIFNNMRYWNLSPDDIKVCILTHPHFDHAAGAHLLKARGVKLIAHSTTAEAVSVGDERCCGYLYHKTFVPCEVDQTVEDGEVVDVLGFQIEAMHLPGHSMGCTAFLFHHEGKRICVSGDVIGTLLAGHFGWSGSFDFNKEIYLKSLIRFAKVDTDMMLPGHGIIYCYKPRRRVEEAMNIALMEWR